MKQLFLPALRLTIVTMVLFGVLYPLGITGLAWLVGPNHGKGELVVVDKKEVGFQRIGQLFNSVNYFRGRPSAVNYNAAATGGSNKGPTNEEYIEQVEQRIRMILEENPGITRQQIPVDLVTASGGGLDPDISPEGAMLQVDRIAKARKIPAGIVRNLVNEHTRTPFGGFLGTPVVNVLELNIALDQIK